MVVSTSKAYIGSTRDFHKRMYKHETSKLHSPLSMDIQKFGWDSFLQEIILDSVPAVDLKRLEDLFVDAEDTMVPRGCLLCESAAHEETYGWSCPTCRARLCGVCRAQMHKARESNRTLRARQPNSCSSPGVRAPLHAAALRGQHPDASEGLLHTRASARPDSH